jgi:CDP-glucose 4,6-dehydratase
MKVNGFEWEGKKVLVTGASGFKGAWLCRTLVALGAEVYGTVRYQVDPDCSYALLELDHQITNLFVDVCDLQAVLESVNSIQPDAIFHLAAKSIVREALRNPHSTFYINFTGALNVLEACRRVGSCPRILVCSTDHAIGGPDPSRIPPDGFDEKTPIDFSGPYDTSKAAEELVTRSFHATYPSQLRTVCITRCSNVFGLGDTNRSRVIPRFVTSAKKNKQVPLQYRKNGRQFIYITDAIAGYVRALSSLSERGPTPLLEADSHDNQDPFTPTFHFSIERYSHAKTPYITLEMLAREVAQLFGATVDDSCAVDYAPNENRAHALNCARTRSALGWRPQTSLTDGLRKMGHWFDIAREPSKRRKMLDEEIGALVSTLTNA